MSWLRSALWVPSSALALVLLVSGCGGGGSGSTPPPTKAEAPVVTQQPAPVTVNAGSSASFAVAASGTAPLTYQWQRNGQDIAGATSPTLTLDHVAGSDYGSLYRAVVSNAAGSATSNTAALTVITTELTIYRQPSSVNAKEGTTASLQVGATGPNALVYQWFRAGQPIPGANAATLDIGPVRFGDDVDYTVQVSDTASTLTSTAAALTIAPAAAAKLLAGCVDIAAPGAYALTGDIAVNDSRGCIAVHDTHDVQIDCGNHRLTNLSERVIRFDRVTHFSMRNCTVEAYWVDFLNVDWGSISGSSFGWSKAGQAGIVLNASNTDHLVFSHNTVSGSFQSYYADSPTVSDNRVTGSSTDTGAAGLITAFSRHARVSANTIDGAWTGQPYTNQFPAGLDDGIVVSDVTDATIENNVIRNVWDAGIEWGGGVGDSIIRGNQIDNAGVCGIGGWYWASVWNVQFLRNTMSRSPQMFIMYHYYGLRAAGSDLEHTQPADTEVRFRDNLFDGNIMLKSSMAGSASYIPVFGKMGYSGSLSAIAGERVVPDNAFSIGNNTFRNNDFGAGVPGPIFGGTAVPGIVIDGGGNKCAAATSPDYPLKCS